MDPCGVQEPDQPRRAAGRAPSIRQPRTPTTSGGNGATARDPRGRCKVAPAPRQPDMPTRRIKGLRWWMIGLLMLGSIINYLTRSTLAVAAPTILKDLQISTQEYSYIVGTF